MPKPSSRLRSVELSSDLASSQGAPRPAVLYARAGSHRSPAAAQTSLVELTRLVQGLGLPVAHALVHRGGGSRLIGTGKLQELAARLAALAAASGVPPLFVVDEALRPGQLRLLEAALGAEVSDRTDVILRVFERRANTRMARLEVEMARLSYDAPRVRDLSAINDRSGGGGRGERGHTGVELRKQRIRARLVTLGRELAALRRLHDAELERRSEAPSVALVGYTNAGKSSLMRALTGSDVFVENQLFATLSTTVRALAPVTAPRILVTDTVGFIEDLPHELVASFRSTLAEARAADLLLFVVDAADDAWRGQLRVAQETVAAIGAEGVPALVVCNKIDRASPERKAEIAADFPQALQLSALVAGDVQRLRAAVLGFFDDRMLDDVLCVPPAQARLLGEIHGNARVLAQEHDQAGAWLRVRTLPGTLAQLRHQLPALPAIETPADLLARAGRHGLEVTGGGVDFDRSGLDFLVVHARDAAGAPFILRTPRRPEAAAAARGEARVLRLVAPRLSVAVPRWQIHAPELIAYRRLDGTPAVTVTAEGPPSWNLMNPQAPSEAFLDSYAAFLVALQGIEAGPVRNAGLVMRSMVDLRKEQGEAMARVKEALAPSESLWERWQRWLADDELWPTDGDRVLVHGDLHPGHWLLDADGRLTGVLDWTEAAFSDPAIDLALFHGSFGAAGVARLLPRMVALGSWRTEKLAAHAAERWAAFPASLADWALRRQDAGVMAFARAMMGEAGGASSP